MAAADGGGGGGQRAAKIDDFCCNICFELCVDPVVGNCGHDFCRHCLTRWTTQQRRAALRTVTCPVCRGVFASTAVQDLNVCIRLRDTIQLLFPEQLESRKAEVQREQAANAAAAAEGAGGDAGAAASLSRLNYDSDDELDMFGPSLSMLQQLMGTVRRMMPPAPAPPAPPPFGSTALGLGSTGFGLELIHSSDHLPGAPANHVQEDSSTTPFRYIPPVPNMLRFAAPPPAGLGAAAGGAVGAGAGAGSPYGSLRPLSLSPGGAAAQPAGSAGLGATAAAAVPPLQGLGFFGPLQALPDVSTIGQRSGFDFGAPAAATPPAAAGPASFGGLGAASMQQQQVLQWDVSPGIAAPQQQSWLLQQQQLDRDLEQQLQRLRAAHQDSVNMLARLAQGPLQLQQQQELTSRLAQGLPRQPVLVQPQQQQPQQQQPQRTAAAHVGGLVFLRPEGTSPMRPPPAAGLGATTTVGAHLGGPGMLFPPVASFAAAGAQGSRPLSANLGPSFAPPSQQLPVLPSQPVFTMGWYHPRSAQQGGSSSGGPRTRRRANLRFQRPGRRQHQR